MTPVIVPTVHQHSVEGVVRRTLLRSLEVRIKVHFLLELKPDKKHLFWAVELQICWVILLMQLTECSNNILNNIFTTNKRNTK